MLAPRGASIRGSAPRGPAWAVLAVVLGLVGLALRGAADWRTDNRLERWVEQLPSEPAWDVLRERFGGDETILARVDGIGRSRAADEEVAWLRALGPRLARQPAVSEVADPLGLPGLPDRGPIPWERLAARPLVRALDLASPEPGRLDFVLPVRLEATPEERAAVVAELAALADEARARGLRLRAAGHPLVAQALDLESARVERVFVPALVGLAALAIGLFLRSVTLAALTILPAIGTSAGVRAVLAHLGRDSDLILVAVGPLTFVLMLASTLHLVLAFRARWAGGEEARAAARGARAEKLPSIALATLTTAVGFAVFASSGLRSVSDLGLAVAASMLAGMAGVLAVLPLLLGGLAGRRPPAPASARSAWRALAVGAVRARWAWIGLGLACVLSGALSATRLSVQTNGLHYFPSHHPVRAAFTSIEAEGSDLSNVEVLARRADGAPWSDGELGALELGARLASVPGVSAAFGPEDMIAETETLGPLGRLARPAALRRAGRLDAAGVWARWSVRFPTLGAEPARDLVRDLRSAAKGAGREVLVAGSVVRMLDMQRTLVGTLASSLGWTVLVTTLLFRLAVRSLRELCVALFVNLVPVGIVFLLAALAGIPLDGATAMVAAVVLGLAVDNTFHLLHAGDSGVRSRLRAFDRVGQAAAVSSAALALGFASLAASGFAPTERFGALCAAGSLAALWANLVLLPALWVRPVRAGAASAGEAVA